MEAQRRTGLAGDPKGRELDPGFLFPVPAKGKNSTGATGAQRTGRPGQDGRVSGHPWESQRVLGHHVSWVHAAAFWGLPLHTQVSLGGPSPLLHPAALPVSGFTGNGAHRTADELRAGGPAEAPQPSDHHEHLGWTGNPRPGALCITVMRAPQLPGFGPPVRGVLGRSLQRLCPAPRTHTSQRPRRSAQPFRGDAGGVWAGDPGGECAGAAGAGRGRMPCAFM